MIAEKIKDSTQTLNRIDSKIDIIAKERKQSEDNIKTITEGVISNTVKIDEESKQSTQQINALSEKMDSLIESHISLKKDYITL